MEKLYCTDFLCLLRKRLIIFIGRAMVQGCKIRAGNSVHLKKNKAAIRGKTGGKRDLMEIYLGRGGAGNHKMLNMQIASQTPPQNLQ